MYQVKRKQNIPITLEKAWDFFSNIDNLVKITPVHLNYKIHSRSDAGEMYPGMIITYYISPILNLSIKWGTEITQIKEHSYFIDNQIKGPFKIWHHEHRFMEKGNSVEVNDILYYDIPYGFIGRFLNKFFISKRVNDIFDYREQKIKELFGSM